MSCTRARQVLPLVYQDLVRGHLLLSLLPWHALDCAGELDKSNANRGLQVGSYVVVIPHPPVRHAQETVATKHSEFLVEIPRRNRRMGGTWVV